MKKISCFLLFIILFSCTTNSDKIVVAKFDSGSVNLNEAINEYQRLPDQEKSNYKTDDDYFRLVRKIALEKIILSKAANEGLLANKEFTDKFEETKKNIAYNILKKKNVLDKINIVEQDYEKYKKAYELYQIVKRTDILDENKIKQSKKLLETLASQIKDINSFKEAAGKYSEDITANEGGFVGNIRLGVMEDEIDKVMEKLETGKVSKVIETSVGLHIIFINKIDKIEFNELLQDKKLYESIYNSKVETIESQWYDNLLKDNALKIDKERLKEKKYDDTVIVQFKEKTITRNEILKTVDNLRQGTFPEPTAEELLSLVKNMGLRLILEEMMESGSVVNSSEYKTRIEEEKKFLIKSEYITKNVSDIPVTDEDIKKFYEENKNSLFTFKDENNKTVVQPLNEVEKFIIQKVENKNTQEARYNLYRKLVDDDNFKVDEKNIQLIKKELEK